MQNVTGVRTFVGIDAHSEHCSLKGITVQGKTALETRVRTTVRCLRSALRGHPGPVWVLLEASAVSALIREYIEPVVDRVIACETRENRWIAKSENKSDAADADRLARLLRMGEFQEVYMPPRGRLEIREVVRAYHKAVQDTTRVKNRIKAKYREHGIDVKHTSAYSVQGRAAWLACAKRPTVKFLLEVQYGILDRAEESRDQLAGRLHELLKHTRPYKLVKTLPGVGRVVASILVAVIVDPRRFRTKRKLWRYAGLGVRSALSADRTLHKGGAFTGNRLLKYAAMMAAQNAIHGNHRFGRHNQRMLDQNIDPAMAKKTIARNILATALAMWKSGTEYRDVM